MFILCYFGLFLKNGRMEPMYAYRQFLIQFIQAALGSYFLFWALRSRHIIVKHAGSYNETSISGFPSREVDTSSTPELKSQL